jgi:D-tyrosyl-tRNA(Tyr) deacylase
MRIVLQRVSHARVVVDERVTGEIGRGLLLLVGFTDGDNEETLRWMRDEVLGLRIFPDEEGKMNRSVEEVDGGILVVSQFTLYGDASRGRRPSAQIVRWGVTKRASGLFTHNRERSAPRISSDVARADPGLYFARQPKGAFDPAQSGPFPTWVAPYSGRRMCRLFSSGTRADVCSRGGAMFLPPAARRRFVYPILP